MLSLPIAVLQGIAFLLLLKRGGVIPDLPLFLFAVNVLVVTAGSVLLMWVGELISEYGLGNGVSIIIFAGIVASLPSTVSQVVFSFDPAQIPTYVGFLAAAVAIVAAVVVITEAERPVPVTYAKRVRGMKFFGGASTYLPLRLNQAGVIPLIFALSLLLMPQMIASFFATSGNALVASIANSVLGGLQNLLIYGILYFFLVFLFTYFYTAITFEPKSISDNLQKNGAFIPGVRPGPSTADYLAKVITRITFVGALFLGLIAVAPIVCRPSLAFNRSQLVARRSLSSYLSCLTSRAALTRKSLYGSIKKMGESGPSCCRSFRGSGKSVLQAHLRHRSVGSCFPRFVHNTGDRPDEVEGADRLFCKS